MSSSIEIDFWFSQPDRSVLLDKFFIISSCLQKKSGDEGLAQKLVIKEKSGINYQHDNISITREILPLANVVFSIRAQIYYPCFRFNSTGVQKEGVWLNVSLHLGLQDDNTVRSQGHLQVVIDNSGPFFSRNSDGHQNADQESAESNVRNLVDDILELTRLSAPEKVKVFTDLAKNYSFNVHLLYFANHKVALDDIAQLRINLISDRQLLSDQKQGGAMLHPFRSKTQQATLSNALIEKLNSPSAYDVDQVAIVLEEGDYDSFTDGESFFILDYPFFSNRFLDTFVLKLL